MVMPPDQLPDTTDCSSTTDLGDHIARSARGAGQGMWEAPPPLRIMCKGTPISPTIPHRGWGVLLPEE